MQKHYVGVLVRLPLPQCVVKLAATYAVMKLFNGAATTAVIHSTFAAFIGVAVFLVYLIFVYLRRLPMIKALIETD